MKRFFIILQIALTAASCVQSTDYISEEMKGEMITVLTANMPEYADGEFTKTSIDANGNSSWVKGDKLGFIPDQSAVKKGSPVQAMFYISNQETNTFTSNGWGLLRGSAYHAYYPYTENMVDNCITLNYDYSSPKAAITNGGTGHLPFYDYLQADFTVPSEGDADVTFKRVGLMAKFVLTVPSAYTDKTFTSLELSTEGADLVKSVKYNPSSKGSTDFEKISSISIPLNGGSGVQCNGSGQVVVYAMMYPSLTKGKTITTRLVSSDSKNFSGGKVVNKDQSASAKLQYSVNLELVKPVPPRGEWVDLSVDGTKTANCYIVSGRGDKNGKYMFPAVKGNGSTPVGDVKGVKVLWETKNSQTAPVMDEIILQSGNNAPKYDESGYICFNIPATFTIGNAIIAAYDDAACTNGHVLWSWHIWCMDSNYLGYDDYGSDKKFMKLNLGALSNSSDVGQTTGYSDAIGLLYQWGRKDPFVGFCNVYMQHELPVNDQLAKVRNADGTSSTMFTYNNASPGYMSPYVEGNKAPDYATKNPTVFITGTIDNMHWSNEDFSSKASKYWDATKTINDPCPYGYKVPGNYDGLSFGGTEGGVIGGFYIGNKVKGSNGTSFYWPFTGSITATNRSRYYDGAGWYPPANPKETSNTYASYDGLGNGASYWSVEAMTGSDVYDQYVNIYPILINIGYDDIRVVRELGALLNMRGIFMSKSLRLGRDKDKIITGTSETSPSGDSRLHCANANPVRCEVDPNAK